MSAPNAEEVTLIDTAIIMADSFDNRFTPITLEKPRVLCPLVNNPMIHYTLEFLISNSITKIFIFSNAFAEEIEEHLRQTYWAELPNVEIIYKSGPVDSVGEALRQFEVNEIESDFVLISGDVVSNMDLQKAFQRHEQIRKKDKSMVMTSVFKKASPHHRSRAGGDTTIVALHKGTQQLLHLDNSASIEVYIQRELFKETSEIELRYDLIDCRIDICAPDVITLFHDEFDWQDLRQDFILGILESEILNFKIHTHVVEHEYAARVRSLNTYAAISRDIIRRWTHPLVPDSNISGYIWSDSTYSVTRSNIYMEDDVRLERSSQVVRGSVIAAGSSVGAKSIIQGSVLGRHCVVGKNVKVTGSFLWGRVTIEDNCTIENSILCNGVVVKANSHISSGCILSFDTVVGPDITLEPETKITMQVPSEFNDVDDPTDTIELGADGCGFQWLYDEGDPTNSLDFDPHVMREQIVITKPEAEEVAHVHLNQGERFKNDIYDVVYNGVRQNTETENLVREINALKYSYNCNWGDCCSAMVPTMMMAVDGSMKDLVEIFTKYSDLIGTYLPSVTDEEDLIFAIQEFCESDRGMQWEKMFMAILWQLYDHELISEDAIFEWAREHEDVDEGDSRFVVQCADFIEFLRNASEEEEEEEEEEDE